MYFQKVNPHFGGNLGAKLSTHISSDENLLLYVGKLQFPPPIC